MLQVEISTDLQQIVNSSREDDLKQTVNTQQSNLYTEVQTCLPSTAPSWLLHPLPPPPQKKTYVQSSNIIPDINV